MFGLTKSLFILLAIGFTSALYIYQLTLLHKNDTLLSKWRQAKTSTASASKEDLEGGNLNWSYLWEVIGLGEITKNQSS